MDGNFSAEHMKMCNPADDVKLRDGEGFMVQDRDYKHHLKVAKESNEGSSISTPYFCAELKHISGCRSPLAMTMLQ